MNKQKVMLNFFAEYSAEELTALERQFSDAVALTGISLIDMAEQLALKVISGDQNTRVIAEEIKAKFDEHMQLTQAGASILAEMDARGIECVRRSNMESDLKALIRHH